MNTDKPVYYSDYLGLDKILSAQHPLSAVNSVNQAHDETLFIVVHQAYELWFLQIRHELASVIQYFKQDYIDDNSPEMVKVVNRLQRVGLIFRLINEQFRILETMTPLDFLEFRNLVTPASGFQSKQFRLIEAMLGLQMSKRHQPEHYKNTGIHHGGFSQEDFEEITKAENSPTLLQTVKRWLSRIPILKPEYWDEYTPLFPDKIIHPNIFISDYFNIYEKQQREIRDYHLGIETNSEIRQKIQADYEKNILNIKTLFLTEGTSVFCCEELSSALFIMLYRHYPLLRLPYELLNNLIDIDSQLSMWRLNHFEMVKKMIGLKPGTGGSSGAGYLHGAIKSNTVFDELSMLATYYIEESQIPVLPEKVIRALRFG